MAEIVLFAITVMLAVYGLACLVRFLWSLFIRSNRDYKNSLLVPLYDDTAEFSLRYAVELARVSGIKGIVAVDCGLNDEIRTVVRMFANEEPSIKIVTKWDNISKIV